MPRLKLLIHIILRCVAIYGVLRERRPYRMLHDVGVHRAQPGQPTPAFKAASTAG